MLIIIHVEAIGVRVVFDFVDRCVILVILFEVDEQQSKAQ